MFIRNRARERAYFIFILDSILNSTHSFIYVILKMQFYNNTCILLKSKNVQFEKKLNILLLLRQ